MNEDAATVLSRSLRLYQQMAGEGHPQTLAVMASLGLTLANARKYEEAEIVVGSAASHRP